MGRLITLIALASVGALAGAQSFPTKPIELVNAFAPGGANDLNARALQVAAERVFGQPLVQIFKQGGGGIVGANEVANAAPDGYKLLLVSSGELTAAPNLTKSDVLPRLIHLHRPHFVPAVRARREERRAVEVLQ